MTFKNTFWHIVCAVFLMLPGLATAEGKSEFSQMILEEKSPFETVEETVAAIKKNVESMGDWVVNGVNPLNKKIGQLGGPKILPVTLIDVCNPHHAGGILKNDTDRYAAVMMPCTIAVYEKSDGHVYIGRVNARLVGKMFGGAVEKIMGGQVADDQDHFLSFDKE